MVGGHTALDSYRMMSVGNSTHEALPPCKLHGAESSVASVKLWRGPAGVFYAQPEHRLHPVHAASTQETGRDNGLGGWFVLLRVKVPVRKGHLPRLLAAPFTAEGYRFATCFVVLLGWLAR